MKKIHLLVAVHNHQPIGAPHGRIDEAFYGFYLPFIDCFDQFPKLRLSLHYSGPLLEWLDSHQRDFLDRIGGLVGEGRVEVLGGPFYQPILAWLKHRDGVGQMRMAEHWIQSRLGTIPQGAYLAEQVWEPSLPHLLTQAGVQYTLVAARAFELGGYRSDPLFGYYVTESQGDVVSVFPVDPTLTELALSQSVKRLLEYICGHSAEDDLPMRALTLALPGERIDPQWLRQFFEALVASEEVEVHPVGEFRNAAPATGRVYLPSASVNEAFFSRVLVEHPETNWLLQRAHRVSDEVARAMGGDKAVEMAGGRAPEMLKNLWRGQCFDAYVPDGLYEPLIRHAAYEVLLRAEEAVEQTQRSRGDYLEHEWLDLDKDGHDEVEVTGQHFTAYIKPSHGGSLVELDYKTSHFNVLNTLRSAIDRRDANPRWSFVDHALAEDTTLETFATRSFDTQGALDGPFRVVATDFTGGKEAGVIHLAATREIDDVWVEIEKSFIFSRRTPGLAVRYRFTAHEDVDVWMATELNLNLLPNSTSYLDIPGRRDPAMDSTGELENASALDFVSPHLGFRVALRFDPSLMWWHPLETFFGEDQQACQGTCLTLSWKLALEAGQSVQRTVRMGFAAIG